jgi:hypothetical protein
MSAADSVGNQGRELFFDLSQQFSMVITAVVYRFVHSNYEINQSKMQVSWDISLHISMLELYVEIRHSFVDFLLRWLKRLFGDEDGFAAWSHVLSPTNGLYYSHAISLPPVAYSMIFYCPHHLVIKFGIY